MVKLILLKADINKYLIGKITELENDLRKRQTLLQQYKQAIAQFEAEANAILGSIQTCKELIEWKEKETKDE